MHIADRMMRSIPFYSLLLSVLICFSCQQKDTQPAPTPVDTTVQQEETAPEPVAPQPALTYRFIKQKEWQQQKDSLGGAKRLDILTLLNRVDTTHLKRLDSIIIPSNFSLPLQYYSPFPEQVEQLKDVNKIIFFSYPTQVFAAYENGSLILTGPTNMGKKSSPTPRGLFFTNWKSKKSTSTVNASWILKWNFNVHNKLGVGFHEYALPGYPISHSCMRLLGADAEFLYNWAEQWILKNDREIEAYGTPVIIFGTYPFGKEKPWYQLVEDPNALVITKDSLNAVIQPHLETILDRQQHRAAVISNRQSKVSNQAEAGNGQ